jgi:hypothetical protein
MQTETQPFTYTSNGKQMKKPIESPLTTTLLSVGTAGIIGCFIFLWNQNGTNAKILERDAQKSQAIDQINGKINQMQLDIREVRETAIRIESRSKN